MSPDEITLADFTDALKEKIATQEQVGINNRQAIASLEQQLANARQTDLAQQGYTMALREQLALLENADESTDEGE